MFRAAPDDPAKKTMGKLREIRFSLSNGPRRREFNLGTHYVSAMFFQALGEVEAGEVRKLIVTPGGEASVSDMIDVAQAGVPFDFDRYWAGDVAERKSMIADGLRGGGVKAAKHFGWNERPFVEAPERIRSQRILSVLRGNPVSSPSRRRTAQLRYDYGPDAVRFFAVVRDKKTGDVLAEVPMVDTEPHELRYVPYLGRIRWASEEVLELVPRDKSLAKTTRPLPIGGA